MNLVVVIKKNKFTNFTIATVKFDNFGVPTNQPFILCNNYVEGFEAVHNTDYEYALFLDGGNYFYDWNMFINELKKQPNKGLLGHIIFNNTNEPYLDQQCFLVKINNFVGEDFVENIYESYVAESSQKNLHDDYTPYFIKPTNKKTKFIQKKFGQGLITKQFSFNLPVINWTKNIREIKKYNYKKDIFVNDFKNYNNMAKQQLWIFNNENFNLPNSKSIVCPASGLFWILSSCKENIKTIDLVDISEIQIKFAKDLWENWDGENYGQFTYNFIKSQKIRHFNIDDPTITQEKIYNLIKSKEFVNYCNDIFNRNISKFDLLDFKNLWQQAKKQKNLNFYNANLITYASENLNKIEKIWCSNICDYKWTLLNNSLEEIEAFLKITDEINIANQ